jgi:AcrR family transcriptional regulator
MTLPSTDQQAKRIYAPRMPLEQRRQQILEAALDEYLERGFANARIDSIAEKIGVSKPVLYGAFESKEAIAAAVVEEAHRREALGLMQGGNLELYDHLHRGEVVPLYESVFRFASENTRLCEFLYSDFRGAPPEAIEFHDDVFKQRTAGIVWHLRQFLGEDPGVEERLMVFADLISTLGRRGMLLVASGQAADPAWLAEELGTVLERGLQTPSAT